MWYGLVNREKGWVTEKWPEARDWMAIRPYSSCRKFKLEEDAWAFVHKKQNRITGDRVCSIRRFGNTNEKFLFEVSYFILEDGTVYANIKRPNNVKVRIVTEDEDTNVTVRYTSTMIVLIIYKLDLNRDSVKHQAIALYHVLRLLGPLVDVDLEVKDLSLFHVIFHYSGNRVREYMKLRKIIADRVGGVSVSVESRQHISEYEVSQ